MALRIRCTECRKKISIDEAFAGGMCRCPYCKALVYVEDKSAGTGPVSPSPAPGSRPAAPGAANAASGAPEPAPGAEEPEHVPMARPVMIQGIITIVLLVLLVVMVGVGVAIALVIVRSRDDRMGPDANADGNAAAYVPPISPLQVRGDKPEIAGLELPAGPVVYCLDGGSSMRDLFDAGALMIINSIGSLKPDAKFTILRCQEGDDEFLSAAFLAGGAEGKKKAHGFFRVYQPSGATDIVRALNGALALKPKVIVLIARKPVDEAVGAANKAKAQGVQIFTVVIDGDEDVVSSMRKLSEITGGKHRAVTSGEL
jgi:hypothetical protein